MEYPKLLVERGKGDEIYHLINSQQELFDTAEEILIERINNPFFYYGDDIVRARRALALNKAWEFLESRNDYEYEEITLENLK